MLLRIRASNLRIPVVTSAIYVLGILTFGYSVSHKTPLLSKFLLPLKKIE